MAQKIIITAKSVVAPFDGLTVFLGLKFGNALGVYLNANLYLVTTPSNFAAGQVRYNIGSTLDFIEELSSYFETLFINASVPYQINLIGSTCEFLLGNNATVDYFECMLAPLIDTDLISIEREDFTFPPPAPETLTDKIILSRSPYFFKVSPTDLYDSMKMDLYIYRGNKTTDRPVAPTFQTSKFVLQAGQPTISININKLVNDFVQNEFTQTVSGGVQTTNQLDTVWVYVDAGIYLNNVLQYNVNQTLIAFDGFGYHEELSNPILDKKVLSTINKHIVYNSSKYPLYFSSKDLVSININGTNVPFTLDANFNNQYVGYVDVTYYIDGSDNLEVVFEYGTETITHNINLRYECRNNLINCVFKNKYGFWQKIPFNKLSKLNLEVESQDYTPFISDFGNYNLNQHTKRSYLTNGNEKIVVNTDFLPEEYNLLFKELMLSEQIYLEQGETVLPVNLNKKSFTYKTRLNDKLIQYSMDFEYSFKTINNIV